MRFDYEPSWDHTYETFGARQRARLLQAKYDQNAIEVEARSVTEVAVLGHDDTTACLDQFEQALGG